MGVCLQGPFLHELCMDIRFSDRVARYKSALICHLVVIKAIKVTESQNGRGWKGPLWIIWSNPPSKSRVT